MSEVIESFGLLVQWPTILYLLLAGAFGFFIGVLPGLGGAITLVLLLPLTADMEPETAMIVLLGAYGLVGTGGMITSIVINTPGNAENAATTLDGYPLMRAGRGPEALGVGAASSTIGAVIGLAVLVALIPVARPLVLALSYPEYLMLAVLGLSVIAVVTETTVPRALLGAGLGFLVSFVGLDPVIGHERFTFGELWLWDGVPLVPILIGVFAGAELIALYRDRPITGVDAQRPTADLPAASPGRRSTYWMGFRAVLRRPRVSLLGGLIGSGIGVVPAVGGVVASFLSYGLAKRLSRTPEEFGRGSLEGVAASESANDAKEGGAMVPTVAFGIPGSIGTAIILGALLFHGVPVGPTLIRDDPGIIYVLIVTMIASKLLAPIFVGVVGMGARRFASVPETVLVPIVVVIVFAGTLAADLRPLDLVLLLVFAYVGYSFVTHGFSRIAFVIALVLGRLVEESYHQTLLTFGSPLVVVQRPIAGGLVMLVLLILFGAPLVRLLRRRRGGGVRPAEPDPDRAAMTGTAPRSDRPVSALVFGVVLLVVSGVATGLTFLQLDARAALVPAIVAVPTFLGSVAIVANDVRALVSRRRSRERVATAAAARDESARVVGVAVESGDDPEHVPPVRAWVRDVLRGGSVAGDAPWPAMREAVLLGWTLVLLVLSLTIGFLAAIPVAMLGYCLLLHRFGWRRSVLFAALVWAGVYLLFVVGLDVRLT